MRRDLDDRRPGPRARRAGGSVDDDLTVAQRQVAAAARTEALAFLAVDHTDADGHVRYHRLRLDLVREGVFVKPGELDAIQPPSPATPCGRAPPDARIAVWTT